MLMYLLQEVSRSWMNNATEYLCQSGSFIKGEEV